MQFRSQPTRHALPSGSAHAGTPAPKVLTCIAPHLPIIGRPSEMMSVGENEPGNLLLRIDQEEHVNQTTSHPRLGDDDGYHLVPVLFVAH